MNRKKKINSILKKKIKQKNAKLHRSNKPKYISKAEREKMAQEDPLQNEVSQEEKLISPTSEEDNSITS